MQKLQRASVYYKWIAVSTLTDEFLEFCDEASGKKNPESSILAHLYMACEDYVLTEWCKFLLTTYTPAHLSLHFDGVRISATAQASAAQICEQSEKHILETTGFSVKIREKKHLHVLEMLAAAAKTTSPPKFADDHKLRQAGNCIPHALACLGAASQEKVMAKLSQDSLPENVYMKETRGRTYKQSSVLCECELHPMLFLEKAPKGKWLLHLENGNSPHCVAVESLDASPAMVTVWDVNATFQMTDDAFLDALRCGADSSTVAFFLLSAPSESTVGSAAQLIDVEVGQMLDMAAGALGSVLGINVSSKEPVMVPDSDEEMQDVSLPAQHIACNPAADHGEFHWLDKDGMVTVDQILLNELAEEAARHLAAAKAGTTQSRGGAFPCSGCPFRSFDRCSRLAAHWQRYHCAKKQYCCSGYKQLRVILSLHDSDVLAGKRQGNYLRRSAALLRRSIQPPLSSTMNHVDRHIRLLLDTKGPSIVHIEFVQEPGRVRRCGNLYYTRAFGEKLFQEMLLHNAKAGRARMCLNAVCLCFENRKRPLRSSRSGPGLCWTP